jgi:hypothetical protein
MKYLSIPFLSIVLLFFSSGCCYENQCVGEVGLSLELKGYPDGQYTLELERYYKNGNFDSLIDKVPYNIDWSSSSYETLPMGPNFEHQGDYFDYKYTLLEDGNSFTITDLEIDRSATDRKCGLYKTMEAYVCPYAMITVGGPKASRNDRAILLNK